MKIKQPIVIIGGMGPQASTALYSMLVEKATHKYSAVANEDFPYILIQSLSVPDFISDCSRKSEAIEIMQQAVKSARTSNPLVVGLACNTAHLFADEVGINEGLPFMSMIDTVARSVQATGLYKVGLMASPTTIKRMLYKDALRKLNIECITPHEREQEQIEDTIRAVIAGKADRKETNRIQEISQKLVGRGAQGVIIGCTELPLIFDKEDAQFRIFDCLDLFADGLLDRYYQEYAIL